MVENVGGVNRNNFIDRNFVRQAEEGKENDRSFADSLYEALDGVNQTQIDAEQAADDMLAGDIENIHQVMIKTEEARLSLQLTGQVVNKVLDAYQEISRMQI